MNSLIFLILWGVFPDFRIKKMVPSAYYQPYLEAQDLHEDWKLPQLRLQSNYGCTFLLQLVLSFPSFSLKHERSSFDGEVSMSHNEREEACLNSLNSWYTSMAGKNHTSYCHAESCTSLPVLYILALILVYQQKLWSLNAFYDKQLCDFLTHNFRLSILFSRKHVAIPSNLTVRARRLNPNPNPNPNQWKNREGLKERRKGM